MMKTCNVYIDGELIADVVDAALEQNVMLADMKKILLKKYKNHKVEFRVEERKD